MKRLGPELDGTVDGTRENPSPDNGRLRPAALSICLIGTFELEVVREVGESPKLGLLQAESREGFDRWVIYPYDL